MTNRKNYIFAGSYTTTQPYGIRVFGYQDGTTPGQEAVFELEVPDISYICASPVPNIFYALTEGDRNSSAIHTLKLDRESGRLTILNTLATSGMAPCHMTIDPTGGYGIVACYGSGRLDVAVIEPSGIIKNIRESRSFSGHGPVAGRQEASHLHCSVFSPDGRYLFVTDLGTDSIYRFPIHPEGYPELENYKNFGIIPGSGPRHLVFDAEGKFMYLNNELSGTVMSFSYGEGEIRMISSVIAESVHPPGGAGIIIGPDGNFLYASNRDVNDGIAVFDISGSNGILKPIQYFPTGKHPRHIVLGPDGNTIATAERDSGIIEFFRIDNYGKLSGLKTSLEVPEAVFTLFA